MPEAVVAPVAPTAAPIAAKPAPTTVPIQPAARAPVEPKAPAAAEESYEVTVAGEKRKMSKADLIKAASKVGFADKMSQQAKEALRVLKEREAKLKESESIWDDDEKLEAELTKRGKLDKLARKRLEQKVAESQLTPEQQEVERSKAEKAELQKRLDERDAADKKAKEIETQKVVQSQMEKQLADAADRAGMSKDPDSFYAIYEAVKEAVDLGLPWDPERIITTAQENVDGGFKRLEQSVLKGLKGQALVDRLGPEVVKEVLRHRTEQFRNGGARPAPLGTTPKPPAAADFKNPSDLANKYRGGQF